MDRLIIEDYANGGQKLHLAISGLTAGDFRQFPIPNTWSIQQVVIHLLDAELIMAERAKRVIAEETPPLTAFSENMFMRRLFPDEQSVEDAVTIIDLNRKNFAKVLRKLPDADFERTGIHSEIGPLRLSQIIEKAVGHLDHHLKFITAKREAMGKLMW